MTALQPIYYDNNILFSRDLAEIRENPSYLITALATSNGSKTNNKIYNSNAVSVSRAGPPFPTRREDESFVDKTFCSSFVSTD